MLSLLIAFGMLIVAITKK
ncbi:hypothetical protein [Limosilactobacillus fermentum]